MQGQRRTVGSVPEAFEFDNESSSSSSLMVDPEVHWNSMINEESPGNYFPIPNQSHAAVGIATGSNNDLPVEGIDINRMPSEAEPIIGEDQIPHGREPEENYGPYLDNTDENVTRNQINTEQNILLGADSSHPNVTSPTTADISQQGGEGRRPSYKRKSVGGTPGQSFCATSSFNPSVGSITQALNSRPNLSRNSGVPSLPDNIFADGTSVGMPARVDDTVYSVASDRNSTMSGENAENFQRNSRFRTNQASQNSIIPAGQTSAVLGGFLPPGNFLELQNVLHHTCFLPPHVHSLLSVAASMNYQMQPHFQIISGQPQYAIPVPIVAHSIPSPGGTHPPVQLSDGFGALREEATMGRPPQSGATQGPMVWGMQGGGINFQGNLTSAFGPFPGRIPMLPPAVAPFGVPVNQSHLSLDFIRRSIAANRFNSVASSNAHQMQSAQWSSPQVAIPAPGVQPHSEQSQPVLTSFTAQVQVANGIEPYIWRAYQSMRNYSQNTIPVINADESLRYQSMVARAIILEDLRDRFWDLRLDLDDMTYEELLALEERMGHVDVGLSEEDALDCLRQRIHSVSPEEESSEADSCCICLEEFSQGEEISKLNCGHEFHTECITIWLMHKNMCPICKSPAAN